MDLGEKARSLRSLAFNKKNGVNFQVFLERASLEFLTTQQFLFSR